jgi:hypothetical protein
MLMNISYMNSVNWIGTENEERNERDDGVCGFSFGEPLKRLEIFNCISQYRTADKELDRCFASSLNYDLFQVNIVSDPSCCCGANREDSYHFFFDCSHYANIQF